MITTHTYTHTFSLSSYDVVDKQDVDRIRLFFKMADTDGSGTLDFAEYVTFFALLSKPAAEFKIAFQLFDLNGDGLIEKGYIS